jgi:DNA-binding transcriptional regulator LsrR (DeoR family)
MRAPPAVRAVAWLYHVDGMQQENIASAMGISRRTVINRLNAFADTCRKFVGRDEP